MASTTTKMSQNAEVQNVDRKNVKVETQSSIING